MIQIALKLLILLVLTIPVAAASPTVAILTPDGTTTSKQFAAELSGLMENRHELADADLSDSVLKAREIATPYNMTNLEARNLGIGIGSSYLILLKSDTLRRSSLEREKYFESYSAIYLVDSRSGVLIDWQLLNTKADSTEESMVQLLQTANPALDRIENAIRKNSEKMLTSEPIEIVETDEESRHPLPYRRIKPEYTKTANLYGIAATVDILAEIDKDGAVLNTRIVRWAGFGLDESVESTVRKMNWRPADNRDGTFTMRIMLRYNFRDIEDKTN